MFVKTTYNLSPVYNCSTDLINQHENNDALVRVEDDEKQSTQRLGIQAIGSACLVQSLFCHQRNLGNLSSLCLYFLIDRKGTVTPPTS